MCEYVYAEEKYTIQPIITVGAEGGGVAGNHMDLDVTNRVRWRKEEEWAGQTGSVRR